MIRLAILISGRGSNMVSICDAVKDGKIPDAEVTIVVSDQSDAAGLERAKERGIETIMIERRGRTRVDHDLEIIAALHQHNIDLICLAGYMRVLSTEFVD